MKKPYQILLTNDDGIQSPGLWAAAETLSQLGYVHVAAPRDQVSGTGRSMPLNSDGIITPQQVQVNGKDWTVYSIGGTPAQTVDYAVLEIMERPPDLVVSGINYGENPGVGITASGTVGAALEGASLDIPSIAISLETDPSEYLNYSTEIHFAAAAHFALFFSRLFLERKLPPDVRVLNINVPSNATVDTPWEITRLARQRYFDPVRPKRSDWSQPEPIGLRLAYDPVQDPSDCDLYVLRVKRHVSVTPLSLDLTARVSLPELEDYLRK